MANTYPTARPVRGPQDIRGVRVPPRPANDNFRVPKPANDNVRRPPPPRRPTTHKQFLRGLGRGIALFGRTDIMRDAIDTAAAEMHAASLRVASSAQPMPDPVTLGWDTISRCRAGNGDTGPVQTWSTYCGPQGAPTGAPGIAYVNANQGGWARRHDWSFAMYLSPSPTNLNWRFIASFRHRVIVPGGSASDVLPLPIPVPAPIPGRVQAVQPWAVPDWWPSALPELMPLLRPAPEAAPVPYKWVPGLPKTDPHGNPLRGPRPRPRTSNTPGLRPGPRTNPSSGFRPSPHLAVIPAASPSGRPRPPGKREKEVKARMTGVNGYTLGLIGVVTEGLDAMMVAHRALPMKYRAKPQRNADGSWRAPTAQETVGAIYRHWQHIDVGDLIAGLIANHFEDMVIGKLGKMQRKVAYQRGGPFGYQTGPAL